MLNRLTTSLAYLLDCIREFGFISGFGVYRTVSFARPGQVLALSIPDCRTSFRLRAKSADVWMFEEVWMEKDYDYAYPIVPKNIIDAGAHVGMTSLYYANRFPEAQILAIEPDEDNLELLRKNTKDYDNIRVIPAALWGRDSNLAIENPDDHSSAFRMIESGSEDGVRGITVPEVMELMGVEKIDLLKMDIEGAEIDVFRGDTSWVERLKMMVIELHDRFRPGCSEALHSALESHHFAEAPLGENVVLIRRSLM